MATISGATSNAQDSRWAADPVLVLYVAAAALASQLLTAFRYGIFRDELYYLACAEHLDWGYVDHPPLTPLLAFLERHIGGDSLLAIRFLPAVAFAVTVWLAGLIARQLGGGRFAQMTAALAVLLAPTYLLFFHLMTVNAFEPPLWMAAAYIVIRVIQTGNQKLWLWFGLIAGIGLENKYGMLFFGCGIAVGLLLTRTRRAFRRPWIWAGCVIALAIWLPNLVWEFRRQWPFLELMHNVRASGRDVQLGLVDFFAQQAFFLLPASLPLWLAGIWWFFFGRERGSGIRGRYAALGWTFVAVYLLFFFLHGKVYYLAPIYPMMFAAGGVALEGWLAHRRTGWLKPVYLAVLVVVGLLFVPLTLPVLSPEGFITYMKTLRMPMPEVERHRMGPLGQQIYADMFGWEDIARETARAYYSLPDDVRARTAITGASFGEAGAIDFFGPKYGLPKAISGHQTYWYWGPRQYTGESALMLGERPQRVRELCENPVVVGRVGHPYARGDEHFDIYWCRPMRLNLQTGWPLAKHWD